MAVPNLFFEFPGRFLCQQTVHSPLVFRTTFDIEGFALRTAILVEMSFEHTKGGWGGGGGGLGGGVPPPPPPPAGGGGGGGGGAVWAEAFLASHHPPLGVGETQHWWLLFRTAATWPPRSWQSVEKIGTENSLVCQSPGYHLHYLDTQW